MSFEELWPRQTEERGARDWISPTQAAAAIRDGDGSGVRIAVLDSGIEIAHPDFQGRQLHEDLIVDGVSFEQFAEGHGEDVYGHGTAVAGIIWEIAPEAEIASFRVLGPKLGGCTAQIWLAAHAAIARGFDVVNCSFACGIAGHLSLYKEWTDRALLSGVHVVAASHGDEPEWPAHLASVLGVDCAGAGSHDGEISCSTDRIVEFTGSANCEVAWKDGGRRSMTGSSCAAARMTGIVARLLSVHPIRDPLLLKALLRRVYAGGEDWE
jgi:subtilisin